MHHQIIISQHNAVRLAHSSRMEFPTPINRTVPFLVLGVSGGIFHFIQILIELSVSNTCSGDPDPRVCAVCLSLRLKWVNALHPTKEACGTEV